MSYEFTKKKEHYSEDTRQALTELFKSKAEDEEVLTESELEECLYIMGVVPTAEDIGFFMNNFDKNKDGRLQISELVDNAHVLYAHSQNREDLMAAFTTIDRDNDGYVRFTELYKILTHGGFMSGDEARTILKELGDKYDTDRDGKFTYAEFVEMFLSKEYSESVTKFHSERTVPLSCVQSLE